MFYAHFVLAKKGPLARIWLAAHWDKKLTKAHVFETNIESSVEGILQPKVKMALRTSGHLLLGIVRIYSRKAKYLLADCNEAFIKIKMAFRPGMQVDLPEGNREASVTSITLPEIFHDFDSAMPDINTIDMDAQVTLNQSRAEDITLKEEYGTLTLLEEDMAFDELEANRDASTMDEGFEHGLLLADEEPSKEHAEEPTENRESNGSAVCVNKANVSLDAPLHDDGFGGAVGEGLLDGETGTLFEPTGLFDDAPLGHVPLEAVGVERERENIEPPEKEPTEKPAEHEDESDDDMYDMGPGSGAPSPPTSPESPGPLNTEEDGIHNTHVENGGLGIVQAGSHALATDTANDLLSAAEIVHTAVPLASQAFDHTTLINNEDESFALAPLDTTIVQGAERTVKAKRKRKLIIDETKNISGEEMKSQLSDTSDIVTNLDLAPPTKRLMFWKETGGVEKLFALPGHPILSKTLSAAYQRHLTTRAVENEDFGAESDQINLDSDLCVEQPRDDPEMSHTTTVSRKRQRRDMEQMLPQDLSHLDTLHLDASRPSYHSDHTLTHLALDVPNFQSQHMFPQISESQQQQMMNTVMQHPPQAHMIQQMLQSDVNQLVAHTHLPDMMHSAMVEQAPPLHAITPSIHSVPSPVLPEAYNQRMLGAVHPVAEPVSEHLLPDSVANPSHLQQKSSEKQMPHHSPLAFNTQLNQESLQNQLPQPDHLPIMENMPHTHSENIIQPDLDTRVLQPTVDEDVTEQCLVEDFSQTQLQKEGNISIGPSLSNEQNLTNTAPTLPPLPLPPSPPPPPQPQPVVVSDQNASETPSMQNTASTNEINQTVNQQPESTLFDSLNGGHIPQTILENNQTETHTEEQKLLPQTENTLHKNEFSVSDDEDDYGAPASVGPALPEEQMADETYEQFEERVLTKRTTHMLHIINGKLDRDKSISFADVVKNNKRKQVAQKFYTFLVLKKQQAVELEQHSSYGDLIITKGPKFSTVYNSN